MIRKFNTKNQKGFTLIELMIVIAIIGILSAIAIPNFLSYRDKGIKSGLTSEAKAFYSAAIAYLADTGNLTVTVTPAVLTTENIYQPDTKFGHGGAGFSMNAAGDVAGSYVFDYKNQTSTVNALGAVTLGTGTAP